MADFKEAEEAACRDMLYVEELTADEGVSQRLTGISTSVSVQHLKRAIASQLQRPNDWPGINVAFEGQDLCNLDATLASYNVIDGDTLYFTLETLPQDIKKTNPVTEVPPPYSAQKCLQNLMFKHFDGRTLTLQGVSLESTVKALREKLGSEKKLDTETLRFLYGTKELKDEKLLEMYELGENSTIHIVTRLPGGWQG